MELDRCPFCGGKARLATDFRGLTLVAFIKCDACRAKTEEFGASINYTAIEKAAEAWNRRVNNERSN